MNKRTQHGSTLIEMTAVIAMMIPLLYVALNTTSIVQRDVGTNERVAGLSQSLQRVTERVVDTVRPALASSIEVRSDPSDPWQTALPASEYDSIRFLTDDPLAPSVQYDFVRDAGELGNGVDDDGDGLVDEGSIRVVIGDGAAVTLASRVELAAFRVERSMLTFTMRCGCRDQDGRTLTAQRRVVTFIRNS